MNNYLLPVAVIIALLMGLTSCEDDVDIDLPDHQPKLVAYCFLNPHDTMIIAKVYRSNPLFSMVSSNSADNIEILSNATVLLEHNEASVVIPFDISLQQYMLPAAVFPIVPGETYHLKVMADGFTPIHAQTTVPRDKVTISSHKINTILSQNEAEQTENHSLVEVQWHDISSETNFYAIVINEQFTIDDNTNNEPLVFNYPVHRAYISDSGSDGEVIVYRTEIYTNFHEPNTIEDKGIFIYLLNCTRDYFLYHRSLQNGAGSSDPFSEPTMVYSNIENGLGCFGSYTGSSVWIPY